MKLNETEIHKEKICDLASLSDMMFGKKHLILDIIDEFLKQAPEELFNIQQGVENCNFLQLKNAAHSMKSSVFIMGISSLGPVLSEMELLGGAATEIKKIEQLNDQLRMICKEAIEELETERLKYL